MTDKHHGYRETYEDPETFRTVIRVWFQPNTTLPGRWLTQDAWTTAHRAIEQSLQPTRAEPPTTKILPDYVLRMYSERKALKSLIEGLSAFLNGPKLATLTPQKQMLLGAQLNAMRTYHDVLSLRIELEYKPE